MKSEDPKESYQLVENGHSMSPLNKDKELLKLNGGDIDVVIMESLFTSCDCI